MFDLEKLWDATNYGFTIFSDEFSSEIARNKGSYKGFSVRSNDKTGSCHLYKSPKSGQWLFTDFGVTDRGVNAIDYFCQLNNWTFEQSCKYLFSKYGVPTEQKTPLFAPKVHFTTETVEKSFFEVEFYKEIRKTPTLERLFPFFDAKFFANYDFKEIKYYKTAYFNKNLQKYCIKEVHATDEFPIYGYDFQDFVKIYQPNAPKGDKYIFKHSFVGKKPEKVIYGLQNLQKKVDIKVLEALNEEYEKASTAKDKKKMQAEMDVEKLPYLVIATGGTDGLNIASLGANVVWYNSENELPSLSDIQRFELVAKQVYYIPDLDATGVKQGVQLGMKYLNVKLVWLPKSLLKQNKKDFRDWITDHRFLDNLTVRRKFEQMLSHGLNFKFWEYTLQGISINYLKLKHFLECNHFYRYKMPFSNSESTKEDSGYFVRVENNIVERVETSDIKNFVLDWITERYIPIEVYNKIFASKVFNQTQLKALPLFEMSRKQSGIDFQYYFFTNTAVKITGDKIEPIRYGGGLDVNIWKEELINHRFELQQPSFETYKDDLGRLRVRVLRLKSSYFKVLINTSRIFWKKDADENQKDLCPFVINSPFLTDEEIFLQETHLLNKMYCIGYLLHQFKTQPKGWMVLGVDFVTGKSMKNSYGGTGKSFLLKQLSHLVRNYMSIGAKRLKDDNFPFDGVTPKTKIITLEDLLPYEDMRNYFNLVVDNFVANQKGGVKYNIPFDSSPKLSATTNYAPEMDPSTKRRLIVYHNSDYYHEATEDSDYLFSRKISDDFGGKEIMVKSTYTEQQWNDDFNFMLECLQLYLHQDERIDAPISNLINKNLLMQVGDSFISFFDNYFEAENNFDVWIEKPKFIAQVGEELGKKAVSAQNIRKKLELYCKAKDYNIKKEKKRNNGSVVEMYCITKQKQESKEEYTQTEIPF